MSTRSSIWIKNEDNTFTGIYCHWDGYLSNNGQILLDHYKDEKKIKKLIDLGSISSLDASVELPKGHTFEHPVEGYVVAYHRDRGENFNQYKNIDIKDLPKYYEEYNYFFINGKWFYTKYNDKDLIELTEKEIEND